MKKIKAWATRSCETMEIIEVYLDKETAEKNCNYCDDIIQVTISLK